ncbi:hypothetical protein ABPG72_017726 [Tetrahymena utriculariae]
MNDSIQIDYQNYSSIQQSQQSANSQSHKSNQLYDKPNSQNKVVEFRSGHSSQKQQLQEINSFWPQEINYQITHENVQSSVQQTKYSNHDKSQPSNNTLNIQFQEIKVGNLDPLEYKNQQQLRSQVTNQNISNQGIISQSSISHQNDQLSFQQSKKSNQLYDKPNSQNKVVEFRSGHSSQKQQLQEINSFWPQEINYQITHENVQSSVQQTKYSNHDKSQPSNNTLNIQFQEIKVGNLDPLEYKNQQQLRSQVTNQNISNQGIISQSSISHQNDQLSFQQSKKSNHDKSQESHDKFKSQDIEIKLGNIESSDNLKQSQINNQQYQLQFTNQNITNQGISQQSQISHKNEYDFSLSEIKEVDVKSINPLDQLQNYQRCQPKQNNENFDKFQLNKEQIKKKLCEKFYELDRIIKTGGEALIFEDKKKKNIIIRIVFNQTIDSINIQKKIFYLMKNERNGKNFLQLINHIQVKDDIHIFIHKKCQKMLSEDIQIEFNEEKLIKIIFNLTQGLIDLYNKRILHLDIKPENILVDDKGNYIYCDYGISVIYKEGEKIVLRGHSEKYASPEQKNYDKSKIGFTSDTYSLGKTLLEVLKKFKTINPNSQILSFVKSIKNIIKKQMIQEEIEKRSDCYSIHSQFSDELLKIKDNFAHFKFFREIKNEINHYLRQQFVNKY